MDKEKLEELKKKTNEISLFISRINSELKREFKSLASAEFCDDYGQTFFWIYSQCMEYQAVKPLFFDKLQNMENKLDKFVNNNTPEQSKPVRKTLAMNREVKGGNQ